MIIAIAITLYVLGGFMTAVAIESTQASLRWFHWLALTILWFLLAIVLLVYSLLGRR